MEWDIVVRYILVLCCPRNTKKRELYLFIYFLINFFVLFNVDGDRNGWQPKRHVDEAW